MKRLALILLSLITIPIGSCQIAFALDRAKMLEVQVGEQRIAGRVMTHTDEICWLLNRNGRLHQFATGKVTDFKESSERFTANSQLEIKKQLETEFGNQFEVRTTNHYVVVARRGAAESYAKLFERIYYEFMRLFRARGVHVVEAEFPLVAIVLPDETSFIRYCQSEKTRIQPGLVGYYLTSSNRVAMYERPSDTTLDRTVIHEATHQVAFNTGIHSRLARHPRWVVEGLATVLEADGMRSRAGTTSSIDRVNSERFQWFQEYARLRRGKNSLREFVCNDTLFETSILDAYSEAWAFSFYLMETRPKEYSTYLQKLVNHDPLVPYIAESRLKDLTDTFGPDIDRIETEYLSFIQKIAKR